MFVLMHIAFEEGLESCPAWPCLTMSEGQPWILGSASDSWLPGAFQVGFLARHSGFLEPSAPLKRCAARIS